MVDCRRTPLVITLAPTGMVPRQRDNVFVPEQPDQIAADVRRALELGASCVHLHARDESGEPTYRLEVYRRVVSAVRDASPDVVISVSTSGRVHSDLSHRMEVLDLDGAHKPDLASLTLGSMNFPSQASVNPPDTIRRLADAMRERSIVPELEIFDFGMIDYAHYLIERRVLEPPFVCNLLLGSLGTSAATAANLAQMVDRLPQGTFWHAAGIGRYQWAMNALGIVMGGHVRTGLEDSLYMDPEKRQPATNDALVTRAATLARACERRLATPAETRQLMQLPVHMRPDRRVRADRVLICGLLTPPGRVGGLQLALAQLAGALERLGWSVDLAITPAALGMSSDDDTRHQLASWTSPRWSRLPRAHFVSGDTRRLLQHLALDGGAAYVHSRAMSCLADRLHEQRYDAVLAVVGHMVPGFARFITSAHPAVVLVSLGGLAFELRARRRLAGIRLSARLRNARLHPYAYRAVDPRTIRSAIFASESWKREAVRAGFPAGQAESIYFGVTQCPELEPVRAVEHRLLWVGRASREKGLHHFLEAIAYLRRSAPVTLTAICAQGPAPYRHRLQDLIKRNELQDIVRLLPPVAHTELAAYYRTHDTLLFDSRFAEPVALVVMEAFAHGLPVVARAPARVGPLLVPGSTCEAFQTSDPREIATAIRRSLGDARARERMRTAAHEIVSRHFSMDEAARRYDAVLRRAIHTAALPDAARA